MTTRLPATGSPPQRSMAQPCPSPTESDQLSNCGHRSSEEPANVVFDAPALGCWRVTAAPGRMPKSGASTPVEEDAGVGGKGSQEGEDREVPRHRIVTENHRR